MKRLITIITTVVIGMAVFSGAALAGGTAPGVDITNEAKANYTVGATPYEVTDTATVTVDELLDMTVTWQDAASVVAMPGEVEKVLTFLVTNTGNGTDTYSIAIDNAIAGDDFDPVASGASSGLYLDANGNSTYDSGVDTEYTGAGDNFSLGSDSALTVFLVNDIPAAAADGDTGDSELTVTSTAGTGAAGTVIAGGGDGGVDAVIGASLGETAISGTYLVSDTTVAVTKTASVTDQFGGTSPIPGATITYTILVEVTGSGTASAVTITDTIPAETDYTADSLMLNAAALTDADDGDAGKVVGGVVTVELGDINGGDPDNTITFDVTIK